MKAALEEGKLVFGKMESAPPTDFSVRQTALYFTVQKAAAEKYASYVKRRNDAGLPIIVRMDIPNSLIETLIPQLLPFGDSWKEFVWTCRRGFGAIMPKELKYLTSKQLLIGPICRTHTIGISNMASWSNITIGNVMTVEDEDGTMTQATQYVFRTTDEVVEELQDPQNGIQVELTLYSNGVSNAFPRLLTYLTNK
jgi:hypothetical protein